MKLDFEDLKTTLKPLEDFAKGLEGKISSLQGFVNKEKSNLSKEEKEIIDSFQKEIMKCATSGDFGKIVELTEKMNEKLKDLNNGDSGK